MDPAFLLGGTAGGADKPTESNSAEPPTNMPTDAPAKEGAGFDPSFLGGGAKQ